MIGLSPRLDFGPTLDGSFLQVSSSLFTIIQGRNLKSFKGVIYNHYSALLATVVPAKSDSDVLLCLQLLSKI